MVKGIHIPAGCEVQIGADEASLDSVGVLPEDSDTTIQISYDTVNVKGSKNEDVIRYFKNMKADGKFAIYEILMDTIAKFAPGLMTVTAVPGTLQSGVTQKIAEGWEDLRTYLINGQNADGSAPTVAASGATSGALVEGDDFFLVKGAGGNWYVYFDTSGTKTVATTEEITLTLSYTPAANKTVKMGAPSVEITPQVVRFIKIQGGKKFQATLWSAVNSSGLTFAFPASSSDKPASIDVTMTGGLDETRAEGDQLIEIIDEIGIVA